LDDKVGIVVDMVAEVDTVLDMAACSLLSTWLLELQNFPEGD
jgi:hypothetical protein